jgi:hypothetical protein
VAEVRVEMTGRLGQQSLLEVPPERRVIVSQGFTAHWGVDSSTRGVSVAHVAADGAWGVRSATFAPLEGPHRLSDIYAETRRLVAPLRDLYSWPLPGLVLFEQASGAHDNPPLLYALGAIQAAVWDGLGTLAPATRMEMVPSATWKKRATGRGDVYKPTKKKLGRRPVFEDYGVAVWARDELGYAGDSWDECDALGMAVAGRRLVTLEER